MTTADAGRGTVKVNDRWVGFGDSPTITGADNTVREFTAVADCPACGCLDVHWLAEPRRRPVYGDTPLDQILRRWNGMSETMSVLCIGLDEYGGSGRYVAQPKYEPLEATVARVCKKCSYQWGQK